MSDEKTPDGTENEELVSENSGADAAAQTPESGDESPSSDALLEQIAELKETQLRLAAESQNARRRAEADVEKARKFGAENLMKSMLPVADSFERAIEAARVMDGFDDAMLEGVEATYKLFTEALAKNGLTPINPKDQLFDPAQHQAISMVPAPAPANTVIDVVQTGYALNDRVLRAAMVVVSQGQPQSGNPSVDENV